MCQIISHGENYKYLVLDDNKNTSCGIQKELFKEKCTILNADIIKEDNQEMDQLIISSLISTQK